MRAQMQRAQIAAARDAAAREAAAREAAARDSAAAAQRVEMDIAQRAAAVAAGADFSAPARPV